MRRLQYYTSQTKQNEKILANMITFHKTITVFNSLPFPSHFPCLQLSSLPSSLSSTLTPSPFPFSMPSTFLPPPPFPFSLPSTLLPPSLPAFNFSPSPFPFPLPSTLLPPFPLPFSLPNLSVSYPAPCRLLCVDQALENRSQ